MARAKLRTGKCFTHKKYGYGNWVYRGRKKIRFVRVKRGNRYGRYQRFGGPY